MEIDDRETRSDRFLRVEKRLGEIRAQELMPDIVLLPEIWGTGFFNFERYIPESEPLQGETFTRLSPWAEKLGCYILAGSIVEREEDRFFNTSLMIGPDGSLAGRYRKIHLFGYQSKESEVLTPGFEPFVLKTDYGSWGVTTCYDLRFPELYRRMVERGAEVLFTVAAWPRSRLGHWVLFNRVRALENLCYMVSCNCAGSLQGTALGGNSIAVGPWGEVTARAGRREEILCADLDLGKVAAIRAQFPALEDRRIF